MVSRYASFLVDGRATFGSYADAGVQAVSTAFQARHPDLTAVIAAGALGEIAANLEPDLLRAGDVSFLPVIERPSKILCVGVNYRPHVEEMGREIPEHPVVFVRFPSSLTGHGETLVRPRVSTQFDFEGELAIVIGKAGRYVGKAAAWDYVAGLTPFMDGSIRDYQRHTMQFTPGKNFPASGAIGPALTPLDAVPDPTSLALSTTVNGELMQEGRISDLIFDVPTLIEYCSSFTRLEPGDIIATGTPGGVGAARTPPRWLEPGDTVAVDVGPVGRLVNPVVDESSAAEPVA